MSVNRVTLIGRVGQDPVVRYTGDGMAIANVSLATSQKVKGQEENELDPDAELKEFINRAGL